MKTKTNRIDKKTTEENRFDKMMKRIKPFTKKKKLFRPSTAGRWYSEEQFLLRSSDKL